MKPNNANKTLVDICVLTAGRFDLLEKCLSAIEREMQSVSFSCALYVLDNGADAEERISHNALFSSPIITKTKRLSPNVGYPKGVNSVISMGKSPLVVFISDDVVLDVGALEKLVMRMDDPAIGICGLKLLFPRESNLPGRPAGKVQHVGHGINIRGDVIHPLIGWDAENPKTNISRDVISVTGAAFCVRRAAFEKAGGMDESYGKGYYEDISLCLTLKSLGFRIYIDTDCVAEHYVGATMEKRKENIPINMNAMLFKSRWMESGLIQWDEWKFW